MMTTLDIYNEIVENLTKNGHGYTKTQKAYDIAVKLHKDQLRKDGTPYIFHPLEVALILAQQGFTDSVVTGAILHDTVEDCGFTLEELKQTFGKDVMDMVDAVSEVKKESLNFDEENSKESFIEKEFEHLTLDELTYKKFIKNGKQTPSAYYIKFADRIHNLRTLGTFNYEKQVLKIDETEEWILPIAKILKSHFFYNELKNNCFKIRNKFCCGDFIDIYNENLLYSKPNLDYLIARLKNFFSQSNPKLKIEYDTVKEYEIYDIIKSKYNVNLNKFFEVELSQMPVYNIYIIDQSFKRDHKFSFLFKNNYFPFIKIAGAGTDRLTGKPYILVYDKSRVLFKIFNMTPSEYMIYTIGTDKYLANIDDENTHEVVTKFITVKTRSGDPKVIPEGSTVLDFAFRIHNDIGYSFDYAEIIPANSGNSSAKKTHLAACTRLNDGDQVIIHCKTDKTGNKIFCPQLKWFSYVKNPSSIKSLISYFESKINTD